MRKANVHNAILTTTKNFEKFCKISWQLYEIATFRSYLRTQSFLGQLVQKLWNAEDKLALNYCWKIRKLKNSQKFLDHGPNCKLQLLITVASLYQLQTDWGFYCHRFNSYYLQKAYLALWENQLIWKISQKCFDNDEFKAPPFALKCRQTCKFADCFVQKLRGTENVLVQWLLVNWLTLTNKTKISTSNSYFTLLSIVRFGLKTYEILNPNFRNTAARNYFEKLETFVMDTRYFTLQSPAQRKSFALPLQTV